MKSLGTDFKQTKLPLSRLIIRKRNHQKSTRGFLNNIHAKSMIVPCQNVTILRIFLIALPPMQHRSNGTTPLGNELIQSSYAALPTIAVNIGKTCFCEAHTHARLEHNRLSRAQGRYWAVYQLGRLILEVNETADAFGRTDGAQHKIEPP